MPHVLATVAVEDFDRFHAIFTTKGATLRGSMGSQGAHLYRSTERPDEVTILFDWDHDAFRRFMASSEGQAVMQEAGLKARPTPVFVEHVTDSPS